MTFTSVIIGGILKIRMIGNLISKDIAPEIIKTANDALKKGTKKCLVDISNVHYMNSSGIGVLITLLTKFRNQGGDMILINPSELIDKLLIIIKLKKIFNYCAI